MEDSLRGFLIRFASADHRGTIRKGLRLVLYGLLVLFTVNLIRGLTSYTPGITGRPVVGPVQIILAGLAMMTTFMVMVGFWKYTTPDPGFVGTETPDASRRILRVTIAIQALLAAWALVFQILLAGYLTGGGAGERLGGALGSLASTVNIAAIAVLIVQFVATMLYTRWVAQRIPDAIIISRTGTYIWLLPVLATVGSFVLIGPLIAVILYWNLLNRLAKQLKSIDRSVLAADLPGSSG